MKKYDQLPPRLVMWFFRWYCHPKLADHIEGDLLEDYGVRLQKSGKRKADIKFIVDVLLLLRPGIIRPTGGYGNLNSYGMFKSYFKIAWRNLLQNKGYSFINIGGLGTGMAVVILIGLWINDELSVNKYHQNYNQVAQVMLNKSSNGEIRTQTYVPFPLGAELRNNYGSDFKSVVMSSDIENHILTVDNKYFSKNGNYAESQWPEMLGLKMIKGSWGDFNDLASVFLSRSTAKVIFGETDPMGQALKIDNRFDVKVTGIYEDLPNNSQFKDMDFIASLELVTSYNKENESWDNNSLLAFVQLNDEAALNSVSIKISDVIMRNYDPQGAAVYNPQIFLHPMNKWYLYSEFKNGVNTGGRIQYVWLFGLIGIFVLVLACINFMNLSTARSEKRAKEVGVRKSVGSGRGQLIIQFFSESFLIIVVAFMFSIVMTQLVLPAFNQVADKKLVILWSSPFFWLSGLGFCSITGLIAGSYPAFYLSSFSPFHALKGNLLPGRFAAIPRKVMVVFQFTVSITLIIGAIVISRQIQFAKSRPMGYDMNDLLMIEVNSNDLHSHFDAFRTELKKSGGVMETAESGSPITELWSTTGDLSWKGKDPGMAVNFRKTGVTPEYGRTVGWEFIEGRDFSRDFSTDIPSMIVNEAAIKFMGLEDPIGETIIWDQKPFTIIGIIKDMITESPYSPIRPSIFYTTKHQAGFVYVKLNPKVSATRSINSIESIFRKYVPSSPFDYKFVDKEYARKFGDEARVGMLTTLFSFLAIFISCLGILGLASFTSEKRTKEIGIRKILGASVFNLWRMLSKDFLMLVLCSIAISIPIAFYVMRTWLQNYNYRTEISWWVFAVAGMGALLTTLLTVSYQSLKAAMANPARSLKSE